MKTVSAEQSLLSVLLLDSETITQCKLNAEDFSVKTHAVIFDAMRQCERNGVMIDLVTVAEQLEKNRTLEQIGGMAYLGDLVEKGIGSVRNFGAYQDSIRKAARHRRAKQIAANLQFQIDEEQADDAVSTAIRELMAIDTEQKNYNRTIREALRMGVEEVDKAMQKGGMTGIPTGLVELDRCVGGYHDSDLIIVAARPAMGKTAFMLSSAHACNVPCGIISAEQAGEQVALRLVSIDGNINSQAMRCADLTSEEWDKLSRSNIRLAERPIWINDQPAIDISALVRQARQWKYHNGIKILFVDYLQKIRGANSKLPRWEQITDIVQQLKNLARELNIPVVALAQVKRDVDQRSDKRPRMGDISDASEIEKEADQIMTLYRDVENTPGIAEIIVEKNRHGDIGAVNAKYIGQYYQFKNRDGMRHPA